MMFIIMSLCSSWPPNVHDAAASAATDDNEDGDDGDVLTSNKSQPHQSGAICCSSLAINNAMTTRSIKASVAGHGPRVARGLVQALDFWIAPVSTNA